MMMSPASPRRRLWRSLLRHVALSAMLLAQTVLVGSFVLESHAPNLRVTHVDEPGTRHLNVHNEATCVVCSTRAMHADVPREDAWITLVARGADEAPTVWSRPALRAVPESNPSRAPPV